MAGGTLPDPQYVQSDQLDTMPSQAEQKWQEVLFG